MCIQFLRMDSSKGSLCFALFPFCPFLFVVWMSQLGKGISALLAVLILPTAGRARPWESGVGGGGRGSSLVELPLLLSFRQVWLLEREAF